VATYARSRTLLDIPQPRRAAAPFVALGLLALAFEADPRLPWIVGAGAALLFVAAGAVRAVTARHELASLRRSADRVILASGRHGDISAIVAWRADELTGRSARDGLSREIEGTLRAASPARLPSASPLRRGAVRANAVPLRAVSVRLGDDRPVAARGVLLTRRLLHDPGSPLYTDTGEPRLARSLNRILAELEP